MTFYATDDRDVIEDEHGTAYYRTGGDLWSRTDRGIDSGTNTGGIEILPIEIEPRPAQLPSEWPENQDDPRAAGEPNADLHRFMAWQRGESPI
jgi:hypothetical protein